MATVATEGLFRVIAGDEVIAETAERFEAEAVADTWHNCDPEERFAEVEMAV
jgi:hypothetical protein